MSASELFFELASDDRVAILSEIHTRPLRLSEVARKLSATVQETSRQLERLAKARLLLKDSESRYTTTPLGNLALSLLSSFALIQKERDFFLSHDISSLPTPFIHRLGELAEHQTINHLDEVLAHSEEVIRNAKEYVWLMADQPIRQSFPHEHPAGVEFRLIFPKDIDSSVIQRMRGRVGGALQVARIDSVSVTVAMNEKTAAVCFPGLDGRMDLTRGFAGEKPEFHRWVEDLYNFYWRLGREGYPV